MSKVYLPYFLGSRLSSKSHKQNSVMVRIATLSVSIGIAVMILALGVIHGFKSEISNALGGFGAHITITSVEGSGSPESQPIVSTANYPINIAQLEDVKNIYRFAHKAGIVKNRDVMEGCCSKVTEQILIGASMNRCSFAGDCPKSAARQEIETF